MSAATPHQRQQLLSQLWHDGSSGVPGGSRLPHLSNAWEAPSKKLSRQSNDCTHIWSMLPLPPNPPQAMLAAGAGRAWRATGASCRNADPAPDRRASSSWWGWRTARSCSWPLQQQCSRCRCSSSGERGKGLVSTACSATGSARQGGWFPATWQACGSHPGTMKSSHMCPVRMRSQATAVADGALALPTASFPPGGPPHSPQEAPRCQLQDRRPQLRLQQQVLHLGPGGGGGQEQQDRNNNM